MSKRKQLEEQVRKVISATVEKICDAALHLSASTGETDWCKCVEKMDPQVFEQWTGVTHALWLAVLSTQDDAWKGIVQMQFDHNRNKQTKLAAEIILA